MEAIKEFRIEEAGMESFPFNVKIYISFDGKEFYYTGNGKFCKNKSEVETYKATSK